MSGSHVPFDAGPYTRLQLLLHLGAAGDRRWLIRAAVLAAVAWVPLLLISLTTGSALPGDVPRPFLLDLAAHVRYLVALPLFALAESRYLPRLAFVGLHFINGGFIDPDDRTRYAGIIESIRRLLASPVTDLVIVVVAYAVTMTMTPEAQDRQYSTWAKTVTEGGSRATAAGWWLLLVSQPLFLALLLAWFCRVLLWAWFLLRVSRLRLRLVAGHPDLAGGLSFVTTSLTGFLPLAFAIGALIAVRVAEGLLFDGRAAAEFRHYPLMAAAIATIIFAGPPLVFGGVLYALRNEGTMAYGQLSRGVGEAFEAKWIRSGRQIDASALEAPDFSATVDLFQVAANVRGLNPILVDLKNLVPLVIASLVPFIPVVFLVLPVEHIVDSLLSLVL